jgi:hypothetical protein
MLRAALDVVSDRAPEAEETDGEASPPGIERLAG